MGLRAAQERALSAMRSVGLDSGTLDTAYSGDSRYCAGVRLVGREMGARRVAAYRACGVTACLEFAYYEVYDAGVAGMRRASPVASHSLTALALSRTVSLVSPPCTVAHTTS